MLYTLHVTSTALVLLLLLLLLAEPIALTGGAFLSADFCWVAGVVVGEWSLGLRLWLLLLSSLVTWCFDWLEEIESEEVELSDGVFEAAEDDKPWASSGFEERLSDGSGFK